MATKFTNLLFFLPLLAALLVNAQPEPAGGGAQPQPAAGAGAQPPPGGACFDITKYGAKPDANIAEALLKAWTEACAATAPSTLVVPVGTFLLDQARFEGPCKAPISFQLQGTLQAPLDYTKLPNKDDAWITFNHIDHLEISGGGVFDGHGTDAWAKNECGTDRSVYCGKLPINLSFNAVTNTSVHDVTTKDSKNFHVNVIGAQNFTFERFTVSAPGESINTDGIHIARSCNVKVLNTVIKTGDDCISVGDELTDLHIEGVTCGPGHGISVGSMGKNKDEKDVSGIFVKNCTFIGTQNGIRVKTWPEGPATLKITNLTYEDIVMDNVEAPIVIDQEYCPYNKCNKEGASQIKISQVSIKNIRGTSSEPVAVKLLCSRTAPCENVEIGDVDLSYTGTRGPITTTCTNVKPTFVGKQNPPICAPAQPQPAAPGQPTNPAQPA